jgi:hypothetical protein|nr:MAG TPA: hypothetical protein [Caudoviricetes sp.]DAX76636.1 MAG TPA: hypothetical protein [Caudoviricetes sp.]
MISLVAERIAELLHISIEQAEKIAPQLQHEIFLNNIIVSLNVVLVVVFFSTFLIVLSIDEDEKIFKPMVWTCRISAITLLVLLVAWQFLTPTLTLFRTLK